MAFDLRNKVSALRGGKRWRMDADDAAKAKRARRARVGKGVALAVACLLLVIPVLLVASPISYVPLITVAVFVAVSFGYLQVLRATLEFDEDSLIDSCVRGEKIEFAVGLRNRSWLAHPRLDLYFYVTDLFGDYDAITPVTTTLGPRESNDFHFDARFTHLGTYSAGVSKIVCHDLLGLFSATITNDARHTVSVLPCLFDIENVDFANVTVTESKNQFRPILSDDMDYAGVREYQLGDPMKTVHWNLSSRNPSGELYTRLFEVFANPGLGIVIDPYAPSYDAEGLMTVFDGLVESALSANDAARKMGVDSSVTYLSREGEALSSHVVSASDSDELIRSMLQVRPAAQNAVDALEPVELLRKAGYSAHGQGNLAFCTSRLEEDALSTLTELKMRRRNPLLFVAVPRGLEDKARREFLAPLRRLDAVRIPYYIVESNENGTEVQGL